VADPEKINNYTSTKHGNAEKTEGNQNSSKWAYKRVAEIVHSICIKRR
jgi:hypothetical protein